MTGFDYVLVGGGLANGLIALALLDRRPGVRVALVEREAMPGGHHTWSFHHSDVDGDGHRLLAPLVSHAWDSWEVRFPGHRRVVDAAYASISSERFATIVTDRLRVAPGCRVLTGALAVDVGPYQVALANGQVLRGEVVIDARGPTVRPSAAAGYQKFVGVEIETDDPSLDAALPIRPVLMDATVAQVDGYRFVYTLPLGPGRALVEDTTFSDGPTLDVAARRERLIAELHHRGLGDVRIVRQEQGVLPMPWVGHGGGVPRPGAPVSVGYGAGWFHPGTGYSLPVATRVAALIAREPPGELRPALQALRHPHDRQARFCHLLNRMLFQALPPARRRAVMERFFRLPLPTIQRFFGMATTRLDRALILCGRPPAGLSWRALLSTPKPTLAQEVR